MRVAIIGAGAAGLAALRHCVNVENNDFENPEQSAKLITVICYEKSDQIGGTWVYTPETGVDNYGIPIHSSMYNSLRRGFYPKANCNRMNSDCRILKIIKKCLIL
ncbi:flavin-containing monooxygenase FMO GS-OX4-like [Cephus cinctus]|uniref:Flavin-containing monooxygenase n=1 Tax=Cephus cinctus TaxID=211228 RepID=A0AAJ7RLZ3_CEPCN|nr:flavin-containing monooxygenase FMO GS-OX4-like [Cephus cinctus]